MTLTNRSQTSGLAIQVTGNHKHMSINRFDQKDFLIKTVTKVSL